MIYKKIRSKVPSLSSLLLVGILSPVCGCDGCDKNTKATSEPKEKTFDDAPVVENKKNPERSSEFMAVFKQIYHSLLGFVGEDWFKPKMTPVPFNDSCLDPFLDGKALKSNIQNAFKSFEADTVLSMYPPDMRGALKAIGMSKKLQDLKTGKGPNLSGNLHNKIPYAQAVSEISKHCGLIYDLYRKIESEITSYGPRKSEMQKFAQMAKERYSKLDEIFYKDKKFINPKKTVLMSYDKFNNFISKDETLAQKGEKAVFGVGDIFKNNKIKVLLSIKGVKGVNDTLTADLLKGDIEPRGKTINKELNVLTEKNKDSGHKLLPISSFPTVKREELDAQLVFDFKNLRKVKDPILFKDQGGVCTKSEISFNSLFFAFFIGKIEGVQFARLEHIEGDPDNTVRFTTNNKTFEKISKYSSDDFAKFLGQDVLNQINKDLLDEFYIPNQSDLITKIIPTQPKKGAPNTGGIGFKDDPDLEGKIISRLGTNSTSFEIIKQIAENLLGLKASDIKDEIIIRLVNLTFSDEESNKNNLSLNHRLAGAILSDLIFKVDATMNLIVNTKSDLFDDEKEGVTEKLTARIGSIITNFLKENVILYTDKNGYCATKASDSLLECIQGMSSMLSKKQGAECITYQDLEANARGFSIDVVRSTFQNVYKDFIAICETIKVDEFLDSKIGKKEARDKFFSSIKLHDHQYNFIYLEKQKLDKVVAPETTAQVPAPVAPESEDTSQTV